MARQDSIFHRLGGFAAVSRIVSDFYGRATSDTILAPFFAGIDMATQIDHQTRFVSSLMGGPASYTNEHLQRVHERLHIDEKTFEHMIALFRETLEDHDLDETDIGTIMADMTARRPHVLNPR